MMKRDRPGRSRSIPAAWAVLLLALLVGAAHPVYAQTPTAQPQVYVVQAGDTLSSIAQRFGTTVEAIVAANGIDETTVIIVGQTLLIPARQPEPSPTPLVYVVQPGDTLSAIALRFGTTVQALAAANHIADPALIVSGQKLVIAASPRPAVAEPQPPSYCRQHLVRRGETLPSLAFRYGTTVWALRAANELTHLNWVPAGRELSIPQPVAATSATPRYPTVTAEPAPVVQGQTVAIKVHGSRELSVSGRFLDQDLPFTLGDGFYWVLAGVDVLTSPGSHPLLVAAIEVDSGDRLTIEMAIEVVKGSFARYDVVVPPDRRGLLDPELSRAERAKVDLVFAQVSPAQQWQGAFGYPLAGELVTTAPFGQQRSYSGGPVTSYHAGVDLDGETGTPVYAPAAGTVVMAEPLQVRGRVVILDHGLGVYSAFWHLSEIDVVVGQVVSRGEVIGLVGNTGLSTGSHLHWEMQVRGVPVDPLQWTRQVFP